MSGAERQRRYREANRQRSRDNVARARQKKLTYLHEHQSSRGCGVCGETDPVVLEFAHIDPATKHRKLRSRVASWGTLTWEELQAELLLVRVRCANCHRRETAAEQGWFSAIA